MAIALLLLLVPAAVTALSADPGRPTLAVDLDAYLSTVDLLWSWSATGSPSLDPLAPIGWFQGAYLGNGLAGAIVTAVNSSAETQALRIDLGRTDLWACSNRQPVGYFSLSLAQGQKIQRVDMRLTVIDATLYINVTTSAQTIVPIKIWVNADDPLGDSGVLVAEVTNPAASCTSDPLVWTYTPDTSGVCANTTVNHGTSPTTWGPANYYTQTTNDGTYTTAFVWKQETCGTTLVLALANSQRTPTPTGSQAQALRSIVNSVPNLAAIRQAHGVWWRNFWANTSFFSFDSAGRQDVTRLESFAHIAGFRYAMAARFTMLDLMGPWGPAHATKCIGPWCQYVWDMNQQVMLYLPTPSNRGPLLAVPALDMAYAFLNNTWGQVYGSNGPGGQNSILWWLANMHRYCLSYGDDERLVHALLPGLSGQLQHSSLRNGSDNLLHVYGCTSPEYPMPASNDCTYDLAIYQWAATTALAVATEFDPSNPLIPLFRDIVARLAPFPVDPTTNAWELATGVPFAQPHRHYSHLLQIHDLHTAGSKPEDVARMQASLDQWWMITCSGPQAHGPDYQGDHECRGFTQAGMAYMSARLNRTLAALGNLTSYLQLKALPNGMYGEEIYQGQPDLFAPVAESAFSAASVVYELLVSSTPWPPYPQSGAANRVPMPPQPIRLWGAQPLFANASFYRLRCEGAFEVSAVRENGQTLWVAVEASLLASQGGAAGTEVSFVVWNPDWSTVAALDFVSGQSGISVTTQGGGAFVVRGLLRGNAVALLPRGQPVPPAGFAVLVAVGRNASEYNAWGSRFVYHGELAARRG